MVTVVSPPACVLVSVAMTASRLGPPNSGRSTSAYLKIVLLSANITP